MPSIIITNEQDDILNQVATCQKKSVSILLSEIINEIKEDYEDYQDGKTAYNKFIKSGEKPIPLGKVFENVR
jgi:predicted DNA-binding protein